MKVLFIGNSYTYYNDMPKIFCDLANSNNNPLEVKTITRGGKFLHQNLDPNDVQYPMVNETIAEGNYDVLFLQEQSYFALIDFDKFSDSVSTLIKKVNAKRNVLYCTWGRKPGCNLLEEHGWTNQSMTSDLFDAYKKVSLSTNAELSPVGLCFYDLLVNEPNLELYNPDLSHPNHLGSCVSAITHYVKVFNRLPVNFDCLSLDKQTISTICKSIEKVYSSLK